MKLGHFFKEGIKNIRTTGSITPSSRFLCKKMVDKVDFSTSKFIVELGAGDGVLTEYILAGMGKDTRLMVFEINPKLCKIIRERFEDDRMILIEDSAEKLPEYIQKHQLPDVDFVVSALPFTSLPKELAPKIVSTCQKSMRKGGKFIQMHYSLILRKLYKNIFGNLKVDFTPMNVPPAFVFVCEKE